MSENSNQPYQLIQIAPDAWRIEEDIVRFFLFTGPEKSLLIDTGLGSGNPLEAARTITDGPIMLVNTHADPDHTGGNSFFENTYIHPAEFANYRQIAPEHKTLPLWDGDIIDLGTRRFEVILVPGHTPGSIALFDRENGILVCGDSIADGPVFIFGENRSLSALIASLEKLEALKGEIKEIYPSHGSFPLTNEAIFSQLDTGKRLLAGELTDVDPPFEVPARMYVWGNASFFL